MSVEYTKWLDLVWQALAENNPARKEVLLEQAHSVLERQRRQLERLPA